MCRKTQAQLDKTKDWLILGKIHKNKIEGGLMALFQRKIGPVFLKEDSDATNFIAKMQDLENQTTDLQLKKEIQKEIKLASYGEFGEKNICFELKNSGMDMYILQDIYLEYGDLSAQIDFIVITRKLVFIIECKNLIGNIEIDNQGNFIRTYELFGKKVKEGIYSPITQNQRHLEVLKNVRKGSKSNFILRSAFEHYFNDTYKSLVVLANPKTYLNAKYAKREVKDQVIRADQIINKIKELNSDSRVEEYSEKGMMELAQFFLAMNNPERSDYAKKYEEHVIRFEESQDIIETDEVIIDSENVLDSMDDEIFSTASEEKTCPRCGSSLILRTATKGTNVGNKFYGCSSFPKCRYTENV